MVTVTLTIDQVTLNSIRALYCLCMNKDFVQFIIVHTSHIWYSSYEQRVVCRFLCFNGTLLSVIGTLIIIIIMDRWVDKRTDGWMDGRKNGWTDGWIYDIEI